MTSPLPPQGRGGKSKAVFRKSLFYTTMGYLLGTGRILADRLIAYTVLGTYKDLSSKNLALSPKTKAVKSKLKC